MTKFTKSLGEGFMLILVGILLFGFMIILSGCGTTSSSTATTTTTASTTSTTSTTLAASIRISGTLSTGIISSAGINAHSAASNYNVVAIDNISKTTYHATSDAAGDFAIDIPAGISYEISIVDNNSQYFGPIVMSGGNSSAEVITGIIPTATTSLGTIVVDSIHHYARPALEPTSILNPNGTAEASSGIPKGAGNCGKTTLSGITTREGADMDQDGIPNLFDADEDNDGIRNGILVNPTTRTVSSNTVEAVYMSSNIWSEHGSTEEAKDQISMRLNVIAKTGKLNEIASVKAIDVPASIKDIATVRTSSSIGSPEGYPAEHSLWKDSGHNLYKTTLLPVNQWIISLCPKAVMNIGDTFTIRVNYTSGGYEDFFITMCYILTDWSKILTYNGTALASTEGTKSSPRAFSTSSLEVTFSKLKDEDGNILAGIRYTVRYGTSEYDASSGNYLVPSHVTETSVADTGATTLSFSFLTSSTEAWYVTPVAESADGQRNGEQCWFIKQ